MPQGKYEKYFVDSPKYEELFDEPAGAAVGTAVKPKPRPIRGGKYEKYFDPEEPGTVPHVPLQESAVTLGERTLLQTVAPHDQTKKAEWLQQRGYEAQALESGQVAVKKKDGSGWGVIDPHRMEWMDIVDAADEIAFGIASAAGGTAMAATGPLGLLKAGAGAAIGGASFEAVRQAAGAAAGFKQTPGEVLTDVAVSGAIGGVVDPVLRGAGRLAKGAVRSVFMKGKGKAEPRPKGFIGKEGRVAEAREEPPPPPISGGVGDPNIRPDIRVAIDDVVGEIAGGKLEISTVEKVIKLTQENLSNREQNHLAIGVNDALIEAEKRGVIDHMQKQKFSEWLKNLGYGKAAAKPKPTPAVAPTPPKTQGLRHRASIQEVEPDIIAVKFDGTEVGRFANHLVGKNEARSYAEIVNRSAKLGSITPRDAERIHQILNQAGYDKDGANVAIQWLNDKFRQLVSKMPRARVDINASSGGWDARFDEFLVAQFDDTVKGRNAAGEFSRALNSAGERGQLIPYDENIINKTMRDGGYSDDATSGFLSWFKGKIRPGGAPAAPAAAPTVKTEVWNKILEVSLDDFTVAKFPDNQLGREAAGEVELAIRRQLKKGTLDASEKFTKVLMDEGVDPMPVLQELRRIFRGVPGAPSAGAAPKPTAQPTAQPVKTYQRADGAWVVEGGPSGKKVFTGGNNKAQAQAEVKRRGGPTIRGAANGKPPWEPPEPIWEPDPNTPPWERPLPGELEGPPIAPDAPRSPKFDQPPQPPWRQIKKPVRDIRTAMDAYSAVTRGSPRAIFSLAVRFAEKWTPNLYKGASAVVNKALQRISRILEEKGRPAALAAAYALANDNREFREWLEKQELKSAETSTR